VLIVLFGVKRFFNVLMVLLCFLLMMVSSPAWSAKLYKWVDKNGQTHYSQIPPDKSQVKSTSDIAQKSSASTIPATRKGDYAYCGDMRLPGPLYEPKKLLLGLGDRVENWRKSLRQSEQSLTSQLRRLGERNRQKKNKYSSSSSNVSYTDHAAEERKRTARQIKEYRCAIAWADRQKSKYSDIKQEISSDLSGAKSNYQAALDAAHQDCGFEPKDFANPNYNEKKAGWKKCMRPHDRKIRSSKSNLKKLRSQANKLN
jgi:hypothetical protein